MNERREMYEELIQESNLEQLKKFEANFPKIGNTLNDFDKEILKKIREKIKELS